MENGNYLHLLNGLGALIGVFIAYLSYRKANAKDGEKSMKAMQKRLVDAEKHIAVLEERIDGLKERIKSS